MLEGKATWQLDQAPAKMFLRLFWFTRGKGTEDIEVISETVFDHPLAAESLAFQCPDMSFEKIMARFKELKYRAAIIGPEGSGKTTLLETIGDRLCQDGYKTVYVRFNQENRRLKKDLFRQNPKKQNLGSRISG
jgi:predicted ATPase